MNDPYLGLIETQWNNIIKIYNAFQEKNPVMEYDIGEKKIYAYPAFQYINGLSPEIQNEMKNEYMEACNNNEFILFIRNEKQKELIPYVLTIPSPK